MDPGAWFGVTLLLGSKVWKAIFRSPRLDAELRFLPIIEYRLLKQDFMSSRKRRITRFTHHEIKETTQ